MRTKTKISAAVAVVAGAFVLASCSPGDLLDRAVEKGVEKGVEAATGAEIDIDEDGGTISISSEDGEMAFGGGTELPDGFPDDVPLAAGEITGGARVSDTESEVFTVAIAAQGSMSQVYDEATGLLESAGFSEESSGDLGGIRNVGYGQNGAISGVVLGLIEDEDEGIVMVTYSVRKDK